MIIVCYFNAVLILATIILTIFFHQRERKNFIFLQLAYIEFFLYTICLIIKEGEITLIFQRYFALSGGANLVFFLKTYGRNCIGKKVMMLIVHLYRNILAVLVLLSVSIPNGVNIFLGQILFMITFITLITYYIIIIDLKTIKPKTLLIFLLLLLKTISFGISFFNGYTPYFINTLFYIYFLYYLISTYGGNKRWQYITTQWLL